MNSHRAGGPLITLTTDFGLEDHYVGTMKGVMLSRCPTATLVDITHDVPRFSIAAAAYTLAQAVPFFPPGTVHLAVIDPGVGTTRRPVAVRDGERTFVAPDNGVLTMVLEGRSYEAVEITNRGLMAAVVSQTFHGRDIFAPAAAALAAGSVAIEELGKRVNDLEMWQDLEPRRVENGWQEGCVLSVDHFGNAITNFAAAPGSLRQGEFQLVAGNRVVDSFYETFGAAPADTLFAYFGSSGFVEIGINRDSAAARLGIKPGDAVRLRRMERA